MTVPLTSKVGDERKKVVDTSWMKRRERDPLSRRKPYEMLRPFAWLLQLGAKG
jgi:hypothetical protein